MRLRQFLSAAVTTAVVSTMVAVPGTAAADEVPVLPAGFVFTDQKSGQEPFELTDFAYLPDGSVLTSGKKGTVAWVPTTGEPRTIATIPTRSAGDLGLTSLVLANDFATTRQLYTTRALNVGSGKELRMSRWTLTVDAQQQPTGLTDEVPLLQIPGNTDIHGITGLAVGPDNSLWVSVGDSAGVRYSEGATPDNVDKFALRSLEIDEPYGKLFRLNPDGSGVRGNPFYQADNPSSWRSKVYASGFRSPFRFSLDPSSGAPVLADVGWERREEINLVQPGQNYKWPCWEGDIPTPAYSQIPVCTTLVNTPPLLTYLRNEGNAITGGIVYSGSSYPEEYRGAYFYGDYAQKKIWTLRYTSDGKLVPGSQKPPFGTQIGGPVKFGAASNGDIVMADIYGGQLRRLSYSSANHAPVAKATTKTTPATREVSFDASSSYDFDGDALTYKWDFGDGTTGEGVAATHKYASGPNVLTAKLTVTDALGKSSTIQLTVAPSNNAPTISMTAPQPGKVFAVNEQIQLSATANDVEDGALTVTWTSDLVHCPTNAACHSHPDVGGTGPNFGMPFTDHPESRVDITAKATDRYGVTTVRTYSAKPWQQRLTVASNIPAAVRIGSNGATTSALMTVGSEVGIEAAETASDGASTFAKWTDGSTARTRNVVMAGSDITVTAEYVTPIDRRYASDAAVRAQFGTPLEPEVAEGGLRYRRYQGGRLYWTPEAGVKAVYGAIMDTYLASGGHARFGAPTTDELGTADGIGRYNHFAGTQYTGVASVYWTPQTGAHAIWGDIRGAWARSGWEAGPLGYPVTSELGTPDGIGRFNHFSKAASAYWTPATGSHVIYGGIREAWERSGWELGPLGYPTTDELGTPDGIGRYNHFSKGGSIYWTYATGPHDIYGAIKDRWAALGWERSYLGYPTSGEHDIPGGRRNTFQNGKIDWDRAANRAVDSPR
ncbi:PQQ-dependent sugar dehydrogenase [Allokutzneria oryzae]|uniref:PQQ-dependent sugar dehydrogenase n=1 Tax=Allokutzneria oryzae TaxID=1378989 RepID=A0ABV5ZZS4_9PSEU